MLVNQINLNFGPLRQATDPMPSQARVARMTLLSAVLTQDMKY